jgi:hypothetical protein
MLSDRSWGEDWCGDAFIAEGREGGEFTGDMKEPIFVNSIAYGIHRREVREASHGKGAGDSGGRTSDDRKIKKDVPSNRKEPGPRRSDEDVDAVWHRRSRPRNF